MLLFQAPHLGSGVVRCWVVNYPHLGVLMKATRASKPREQEVSLKVKCEMCGKMSHVYGYIRHGNGAVCSKTCDQAYAYKRKQR